MSAGEIVLLILLLVSWLLAPRAKRIPQARRDAMNRRIGWRFGYGAGVVDTKRGRYDPTPPPDGTSRRRLNGGDAGTDDATGEQGGQ